MKPFLRQLEVREDKLNDLMGKLSAICNDQLNVCSTSWLATAKQVAWLSHRLLQLLYLHPICCWGLAPVFRLADKRLPGSKLN
jgi:hypothetical protein